MNARPVSWFMLTSIYVRVYLGCLLIVLVQTARAQEAGSLPGTQRLTWDEASLPDRLMDAAHEFVERKINDATQACQHYWEYDLSSPDAYVQSVAENRELLKQILGVVDERVAPRMERYGDDDNPQLVADNEFYRIYQVRWHVFNGIYGEGLLAQPKREPVGHVVVIPDADVDPDQLFGLLPDFPAERQVARRLAENGFEVITLQILRREKWKTNDPQLDRAAYTDREWIYRQAFHMGRHVLGYEIQRILGAVDWFSSRHGDEARIAVAGYGEGGHLALLTAAVDQRIDVALVSGYFSPRERVWAEPIYRNVWSRLNRFGDAEVASLILPRKLIVEHCPCPDVRDQKGDIETLATKDVESEFSRIVRAPFFATPQLVLADGPNSHEFSERTMEQFAQAFAGDALAPARRAPHDLRGRPADEIQRRRQRALKQLEEEVQLLVRRSEHVRDQFFLYHVMPDFADARWSTERRHPVHQAEKFITGAKEFRRNFHEQAMGRFDEPFTDFNARSRIVVETDKWTAHDVVLDVFDGLFAWGVLVVPKDLKPGERRPVVVCQHGRQGVPRDTIDGHNSAYNDFAARLAERGFITFAPHNLYRGEDRYRWLDRKANTIGCTLFSFIIAQHDQILRWLETLPFVDGQRIAFYGLSYGGETAVRVPAILERYCLSICSGDFNQWTRKVAATDQPFSFMRTIEWEMPYWNLGHTFDYAEMSYLMVPRPFMVERGHLDLVGRDQWVSHEFAKARWLYAQLGLADRIEIEFFQGGHSINGVGTFSFLHKHLNWPQR